MSENQVCCPKCGSTQIHAEKRGWGLMTGFIGSRRIYITCLACGKRFSPGEGKIYKENAPKTQISPKATPGAAASSGSILGVYGPTIELIRSEKEERRLRDNARIAALSEEELDKIEDIATGVACSPVPAINPEEIESEVQQNLKTLRRNEFVAYRKIAIVLVVFVIALSLLVKVLESSGDKRPVVQQVPTVQHRDEQPAAPSVPIAVGEVRALTLSGVNCAPSLLAVKRIADAATISRGAFLLAAGNEARSAGWFGAVILGSPDYVKVLSIDSVAVRVRIEEPQYDGALAENERECWLPTEAITSSLLMPKAGTKKMHQQ